MAALLDTNVLLRHFTGEPPEMARRATAFLRDAEPNQLSLVDLVAAELVFVLGGIYEQPRSTVAHMLPSVLGLPAAQCETSVILNRAIDLYERGADFTDAYLVSLAESDSSPEIVSFDRGIKNTLEVRRIEP